MPQKNILLCLAGMTPQIITETLYALTQEQGQRIDEIRIITTLEGRNRLTTALLDPDHGQFRAFCRDYEIDHTTIKFDETTIALLRTPDGLTLADIRTPQENAYAGDQICEIVRELCKDPNTRLYASAAGGRKTMSIYLTAAMQLFGRAEDTLSHVLVGLRENAPAGLRVEDFEMNAGFYYPPPVARELAVKDRNGNVIKHVSTAYARVYVADIPFIRLRGIGAEPVKEKDDSYQQAVTRAQADLHLLDTAYDLRIDLRRNWVEVAGRKAKLSPRELFVYALFACLRLNDQSKQQGFVSLKKIGSEPLVEMCRRVSLAKTGAALSLDEFWRIPRHDFVATFDLEAVRRKLGEERREAQMLDTKQIVRASVPEALEKIADTYRQVLGKITPKLEKAGIPKIFDIKRTGDREAHLFGLEIDPSRIKFLP